MNLLSDAAQSETWPAIKPQITEGKTLYFSHGFSPVFKDVTKVEVPSNVDVILVAPKGSGRTVRSLFREGRGINSSFAVYQDVTGKAEEKAVALGVAVGSGYLYKTTFEKEVYSDLYGERGCLMGGIHGMFLAQYEVLRERGHSPSEAFNETVEEATQSLYPLIGANGMDWMFEACSTTARRGAIDWTPKFKDALKPVFNNLYDSVRDGTETQRSLDYNGQKDYREKYEAEMEEIRNLEIWRAGKAVRYGTPSPLPPLPPPLLFPSPHPANPCTTEPCAPRTRSKGLRLSLRSGVGVEERWDEAWKPSTYFQGLVFVLYSRFTWWCSYEVRDMVQKLSRHHWGPGLIFPGLQIQSGFFSFSRTSVHTPALLGDSKFCDSDGRVRSFGWPGRVSAIGARQGTPCQSVPSHSTARPDGPFQNYKRQVR